MIVGGTPRSGMATATMTVTGGVTKGDAKAPAVKTVAVEIGVPAVAAGLAARAVRIKAEGATGPSATGKRTVAGVISARARAVIMIAARIGTTAARATMAAEAPNGSSAA